MIQTTNRYLFLCISFLVLLTQSIFANAANIPWWDTNYNLRREITITTGANTPFNGYSGYTVRDTSFDSASLISAGTLQSDCDDLRVVRWDGSNWTEIDRHLLSCNTNNTDIRFKLIANIPASSNDVSYYYYYNNVNASAPNALDTTNVYLWYDDASIDRLASYTIGRGDNWHGSSGTNSISHNGSNYSFNTGDNVTNSMRRAVNERDVYIEAELFHTNAFPNDMTTGVVARYQLASGSGATESANHYYATNRADSNFQGYAGYTHDVAIMKENRGNIAIGPADGVAAPATAGNQWRRQALAIWNINNTNGKFWDNDDTNALGPSGWPSVAPVKSGTDSGGDYEGSGDAGLIIAQDQGQIRNILIRRYTETEPVLSLSTQESQLIAYYANDEASWNGTGGEVIDQSVNAYHAQSVNGAFTANTDPALTGDPGTCRYGNFDGNNDYLALPAAYPNLQGSFTITAWINTNNKNASGQRVLADDENNTGGYALSLGDPGSGRLRFFSRAVSPVSLDTGVRIQNNQWYFVSAVHNADTKTREIYVDGVLAASGTYTGNWGTDSGIASIGGETNNAGENNSNFRFDGEIDEVRVYSQALTAADIGIVMNLRHPCGISNSATCGPIPNDYPVYSTGDDLEIKDNVNINVGSGNVAVQKGKNNGNAIDVTNTVGDVITASQTLPTIDPETFPTNSSNDNQTVNNSNSPFTFDSNVKDSYNKITVTDNDTANFIGGGPFYIDELDIKKNATINLAAGNYFINKLKIDDNSVINITSEIVNIYINNKFDVKGKNVTVNGSGSVGGLVVYLYENAEFKADEDDFSFTGVIYGPDSGEIEFGKDTILNGLVIGGDKIKFDDDSTITYTPADAAIIGNISTCNSSTLDHFVITHDNFGINCVDEAITITAIDTNGNAFDAGGTAIFIDTQSGTGNWTLNTGTNANFADTTLNDGLATYTFASGETSAIFNLDYRQGSSNTLNIAVKNNPSMAVLDNDSEGNLIFSPNGFTITNSALADPFDGVIPAFPSQTAGTDVSVYITAYGQTAADPTCGVIEAYSGNKPLQFWFDYLNPARDSGINPTINGSSINNNLEANALTLAGGVTFTNGRAQVTTKYKDAGQIVLGIKDESVTNASQLPNGIRGTTNIIFRPADIVITEVKKPDGSGNHLNVIASTAETDIIKAGNPFAVKLQVRDAEGSLTPNFGYETIAETIEIVSSSLVAPVGGRNGSSNNGVITNKSSFGRVDYDGVTALTDGEFVGTNFGFDEVGIIQLQASINDNDYLGTGEITGTNSGNVGRFVPDHFTVTDSNPTLTDSCGAFSYMDQSINFSAAPFITITAREDGGTETKNYDLGGFWRYTTNLANRSYSNNASTPATLDAPASGTVSLTGDTDSNGQGTLTITNEQILYQRPANPRDSVNPAIPFNADINLDLTVADLTDADGICYDSDNDGTCETYSIANIAGTELRFGRLTIGNAFGSELINLQLPITVEYYESLNNDFSPSTGDSCTALSVLPAGPPTWGQINLSAYQGGLDAGETTPSLSGFSSAAATLTLSAPGIGNQGSVVITPLLDSGITTVQPWLQFDWDNDGTHDNDPTATATFGIYSGNDSTIYLRELY